jgi:hypothetical protein
VALAAVVILLVPLVALQSKIGILGRTPLPKEPQVLKAEARALLKEGGYPDAPSDTPWGFEENKRDLDELGKLIASDRWDRLGSGPRSGLIFWYRESPKPLIPMNSISYRMSVTDPPSLAPGMATAWTDPSGNLLRLEVVPPESDQPAAAGATPPRTDWSRLLAAAELRAEAASYRGRPVFFRLVAPWEKPAESASDPQTKGERAGQILASILFVSILLGSLQMARRNLRLGCSDRNGAFRIASVVVAVHMLGWVFWGTCLADVTEMVGSFIGTLAATLFEGVMLWVLYRPWSRMCGSAGPRPSSRGRAL